MQRIALLAVSLVAVFAVASCTQHNPNSCKLPENALDPECDGTPMGRACTSSTQCSAQTPESPVCDMAAKVCVECTSDELSACSGDTPACKSNTCAACESDNDCSKGAGVCLPTGSCVAPQEILYVQTDGLPVNDCSAERPCSLVKATVLSMGSTKPREVLKLAPGEYILASVGDGGGTFELKPTTEVIIDLGTATLVRQAVGNGPALDVSSVGGGKLTLIGGTIRGGRGGDGDGIRCRANATLTLRGITLENNAQAGLLAENCTVAVSTSRIQANGTNGNDRPGVEIRSSLVTMTRSWIMSNPGGGLRNDSQSSGIMLIGNVLMDNGTVSSTIGGAVINTRPSSRVEFNTIALNRSMGGETSGLRCTPNGFPANTTFTASSNIIWDNQGGTTTQGGCAHSFSNIGPTSVPGNTNIDPGFAPGTLNPHLLEGSLLRGKANADSMLTGLAEKDIDGDLRTSPADIGADQYVAPRPAM